MDKNSEEKFLEKQEYWNTKRWGKKLSKEIKMNEDGKEYSSICQLSSFLNLEQTMIDSKIKDGQIENISKAVAFQTI